ncbi:MAG TPA: 16S rRNA (guanine(966)-N(2))-methyltransferase RsmD [Bacteroidales bacterium]|nr:16S rRNA (guanine(966)-N(2))-methyltransferase RsmD [Bacteroidales bacterium]
MRIISGSHRGRAINLPAYLPVRPTTDYAKEALFNILENHFNLSNLRVLDLFAGTGNISFEFASRGCNEIVAVEINKRCAAAINKNAEAMGFKTIKVFKDDAFRFLRKNSQPFDLIFADPPYDHQAVAKLPEEILKADVLKEGAWFILEHASFHSFIDHVGFSQERRYGEVHFSFFAF